MILERTERLLEFDKIKEAVAGCAASEVTRGRITEAHAAFLRAEIERTLRQTREADLMLYEYRLDPIVPFDDISAVLEKANKDAVLSMGELLKTARLLKSARIALSVVERAPDDITELRKLTEGVRADGVLEKDITDAILSENEMSDNASDKLFYLRRRLRSLNAKLKETLAGYTRNNESSKYLQDNLVTVREGRYVLPVKAECRSEVAGLVHDRSATGATVFIEPFAVVELNNDLRVAAAEEQAEVERILADFSRRVSLISRDLALCQEMSTMFDIVFSKIKYSVKINGILPKITSEKCVKLANSRHPLISASKVVPVTIEISEDRPILLITGPNTGGKTVCLKTVGLFTLMAYFGLYVPCTSAEICVFDGIYCDLGDEQSIASELSTFSSHIKALIEVTRNMTARSLVLLDELGGGTDPTEGAALAVGVVKFIERTGSTAVITTHYGSLKEYALTSERTENASMQFDERTLSPTYRLVAGMPGASNALNIASRLGLDRSIIEDARSSMSEERVAFERIIANAEQLKSDSIAELERLEKQKAELDKQRRETETLRASLTASLDRIKANAAAETKRLVSAALERANEIVDELKDKLDRASEASLLQARTLRNELEELSYSGDDERTEAVCEPIDEDKLTVGASVIVKSLAASAVIKSLNPKRREACVQVGHIKTNVPYSDLGKPAAQKQPARRTPVAHERRGEPVGSGFTEREVMVLGMTVSEAIEEIEPYLISMSGEGGEKTLRIVHGKGTGKLGKGIQEYLKGDPRVKEYRYGRYGEGDNGVTIVKLK